MYSGIGRHKLVRANYQSWD